MAAILPFFAPNVIEIDTMTGKRPAIMQCPENLFPTGAQVGKQLPNVEIVAMDIMQPDHIRVKFLNPFEKGDGCTAGTETAVIQQPAAQGMKFDIRIRADLHRLNIVTAGNHSSVGKHTGMSLRHQLPAFLSRNPSGAAIACDGVDEQVSHALAS